MTQLEKGLNRTTLKIIAIISMVIDHTAWGFVDFYSPLGQFLHVCGRLTIPIMCFFVAEGFRHTRNLKAYIGRMSCFAILSVIPFYLFFHEEYDYRQNIIFDLLLALLVLTTLESSLKKVWKVLITIALFGLSLAIGGWVVMPILFVLIFYYGKNFKQKAIWFCVADVALVVFLMIAITLNSRYHFAHYDWVWWDKSYLLGFMLALPLLAHYNGRKGKDIGGRYFFYVFYPAHFMVLWTIKSLTQVQSFYPVYLGMHVLALIVVFFLLFKTIESRPSRGQNAIFLFEFSAILYVFGFLLEILATTTESYYLAILVEYFGEMLVMIGLLLFTQIMFKTQVPKAIYVFQVVAGILVMIALFTTRENHFFYQDIIADNSGELSKLVLHYGPGFYLAIGYIGLVCVYMLSMCIRNFNNPQKVIRKRARLTVLTVGIMWIPYLIKLTGLTYGYEIPGVGIMLAAIVFYQVLFRYGVLDTTTIATDNIFENSRDGIVVVGLDYHFQMENRAGRKIFGAFAETDDIRTNPLMAGILSGRIMQQEIGDSIYEFRIDTLKENGYEQGLMLRAIDATDRIRMMREMKERATKDALTGLYNRNYFASELNKYLMTGGCGCFLMADMDNFKAVNDTMGHQTGDDVLVAFGGVLKAFPDTEIISARLGGDEFVAFIKNKTEETDIGAILQGIMSEFAQKLIDKGIGGCTSVSIGAVIVDRNTEIRREFAGIYSLTDQVLYEAKQSGKNRYTLKHA